MIERDEIRAQMGRQQVSIAELSRRTGLQANSISSFLNGGDAKISSITAIVGALGGKVDLSFCPSTQSAVREMPHAG